MKLSSYAAVEKVESTGPPHQPVQTTGIVRWVLVLGLCVLLMFAVLAFGAVEEWSTFAFEAGTAVLFLIWAGKQLVSKQVTLSTNPLYLPVLFFFLLVIVQIVLRRSAYAYITKYEALKYVSYGIVLLIAAECVREAETRRMFAMVMTVFGALYSFFALAQELTSNGRIFWVHSPRFHGSIYGSYVNHDHYAGLMEMLVPVPLVLGMGHMFSGGKRVLVGFSAVLMATTIFLSGSRGGVLAFFFELALLAALAFARRRNLRVALGSMAVCVFILALLIFVGKGKVLGRLGDLSPGIRLNISKDSLRMFTHRPVLGWGLGTFPTVYPSFRSFYTNLFINEAHNDYAQLLVETGLLGFGAMLWFLIGLYRSGLRFSRRWEFRWDGALSFAALLGCSGMLLHSFVDFNLHIPANAAIFYVLSGLAASELPRDSHQLRRSRSRETEEFRERPGAD